MTPAQKIKSEIADWCRGQGFKYFAIVAASKNGTTDCIIDDLYNAWYFEVKSENDKLSSLQKHTIKTLNTNRERAFTVGSVAEVICILNRVSKAKITDTIKKPKVVIGSVDEF